MTIHEFAAKKERRQKISMITCYDFSFAQIINSTDIDSILVGDSLAMVMHGHPTTLQASIELMSLHIAAVAKGASKKLIIGDLPFLSYRSDLATNMKNILQIMQAGAHAVKLEGAKGNLDLVRHCVDSGVPVMGHLGLTPQSIHQLGGFKVQGKNPAQYDQIVKDALALEAAGAFSVVLECIPSNLAKEVSAKLKIPTIGIGAGPDCDGQVLVLQDMLGMNPQFSPKFLKKYLQGFELIRSAINEYHQEVVSSKFPTDKESYS